MSDYLTANTTRALLQMDQSGSAEALKKQREMERIDKAAKDFEAVFFTEMMKPMFEDVDVSETFGGGKGEEVFQGMILQEYGKLMAETNSIGIADQVKAHLIKAQENAEKNTMTAHQQSLLTQEKEVETTYDTNATRL